MDTLVGSGMVLWTTGYTAAFIEGQSLSINAAAVEQLQRQAKHIMAELRARKILNRTLDALGFTRVFDGRLVFWVLEKGDDMLTICEDGTVYLNGHLRCLVKKSGEAVPHGDLVLSKLLSLCTVNRRKIKTLDRADNSMLDRLLPLETTRPILARIIREEVYNAAEAPKTQDGGPGDYPGHPGRQWPPGREGEAVYAHQRNGAP
jgi:hypothetical protein